MKHLFRSLLVVVALVVAGPALAQTIIVISHGQANDPFWQVVKNGVLQAAKDTGADVSYGAPESFNMAAMSDLIDEAVARKPDGLVVTIPDEGALGPAIHRAVVSGIPVVSMNAGSDVSKSLGVLLHVGQDEFDAGKAAGEKLAEMGGARGICINQEVGNVSLDLRCEGFARGFGGEVTVLPTSNDPAEIEADVRAALEADPSVDTVMALGAPTAGEASVAAVRALKRVGEVRVASFDLSASFLESVANGAAAFAIDQQQFLQGYLPVVFLALNAKYGLIPGGNVPSGPNLITADKAAQVVALSAKGIR